VTNGKKGLAHRAAGLLGVTTGAPGARQALAAAALLAVAVLTQYPASALYAKTTVRATTDGSVSFREPEDEARWVAIQRWRYVTYMPGRRWLRFASLGNDSLAADAVWIKSAGYVSSEFQSSQKGKRFEWLGKLYAVTMDLDPRWEQACRLGAMILATVGEETGGSVDLLVRGMSASPDSWRLPYEAGVTCLMWPGHGDDAERYFKLAVARARAAGGKSPPQIGVIKQILPNLAAEAGRLDVAIAHARARALDRSVPAVQAASRRQLREWVSQQLEDALEDAVGAFMERAGRNPESLWELRRAGMLAAFDRRFAQAVVVFEDSLARLVEIRREVGPEAGRLPVGSDGDATPEALAASGFMHRMILEGRYAPPEAADAYGRPFLYHPRTGTVRSEGLAIVRVQRTTAILRLASGFFHRRNRRFADSLGELAEWIGRRIAEGKQLQLDWVPVFEGGRPPVHPLAAWGEGYPYDPATGRIALPEKYEVDLDVAARGDLQK